MRRNSLEKKQLKDYLVYALSEIGLIIIGILIAVNINESVRASKDSELRCIYLNELLVAIDNDIKDAEGNKNAFDKWNPKIHELYNGLLRDTLDKVDSLSYKFGTLGNFIFFAQGSQMKIEELKYSNINLINNRQLKNEILSYQDWILAIKTLENRYDFISEDIRKYYAKNFRGYNYGEAIPLDIDELKKDNYYRQLIYQRLKMNYTFRGNYKRLIVKQNEIRELINTEITTNCK